MINSSHKIQCIFCNFTNASHFTIGLMKNIFCFVLNSIISMKSITCFVVNSLNKIELTQREFILHLSFDSILTVWMRKMNWYAYRLVRCLFILVSMANFCFLLFITYHPHSPHFATWLAMVWIMPLSFAILILLLFPSLSLLLFWSIDKT